MKHPAPNSCVEFLWFSALAACTACIVVTTGDPDSRVTLGDMLVLLCIPALALWAFVWRLASQGNFLVPETSACELAEDQGEEQSQEPDGLV